MDEMTLHSARRGDPAAFERLVAPCEQMIWRVCWHYMGNEQDAQDCMQEAMLKAWRAIRDFRGDSALETWLYRIAATTCLDALRRKRVRDAESVEGLRESGWEPAEPGAGPEETALKRDSRSRLRAALTALPEKLRDPLVLYALEGRSYEEIAAMLRLPAGTVKSRIARAREQLKKSLEDAEPSAPSAVQRDERRTQHETHQR